MKLVVKSAVTIVFLFPGLAACQNDVDEFNMAVDDLLSRTPNSICPNEEYRDCFQIGLEQCKSLISQNFAQCRNEVENMLLPIFDLDLESFPTEPDSINSSDVQNCFNQRLAIELDLDFEDVEMCLSSPIQSSQ